MVLGFSEVVESKIRDVSRGVRRLRKIKNGSDFYQAAKEETNKAEINGNFYVQLYTNLRKLYDENDVPQPNYLVIRKDGTGYINAVDEFERPDVTKECDEKEVNYLLENDVKSIYYRCTPGEIQIGARVTSSFLFNFSDRMFFLRDNNTLYEQDIKNDFYQD